jgi:hypothetical protein
VIFAPSPNNCPTTMLYLFLMIAYGFVFLDKELKSTEEEEIWLFSNCEEPMELKFKNKEIK